MYVFSIWRLFSLGVIITSRYLLTFSRRQRYERSIILPLSSWNCRQVSYCDELMRLLLWQTTVMDSCGEDVELLCRVLKCLASWLAAYFIPLSFLCYSSSLLASPFAALVCPCTLSFLTLSSSVVSNGYTSECSGSYWSNSPF